METASTSWRVIVVMGVAGSGKSTIGRLLAERHDFVFVDADEYHSPANKALMKRELPLDDAARAEWLAKLRERIDQAFATGETIVLACSALKASYRERLGLPRPGAALVYLRITPEAARQRVERRAQHFMPPSLVASQFEALEVPTESISVEAEQPPQAVVGAITDSLGLA